MTGIPPNLRHIADDGHARAAAAASAERLDETFRAYVAAANETLRVFVDYKFLRARESQVEAANRVERRALDAHVAAIEAVRRAY